MTQTTPETPDEQMARAFHECYERLAPTFYYHTADGTHVFDPNSPNGRLMIATVAEVVGPIRLRLAEAEKLSDEYARLWHRDAAAIQNLRVRLAEAEKENRALRANTSASVLRRLTAQGALAPKETP